MIRPILTLFLLSIAGLSRSQSFKLTIIDAYGNRTTSAAAIRNALGLKEGDSLHMEQFRTEPVLARLLALPNVKNAALSPVCCDDQQNGLMLFVGIAESDSVWFNYNAPPSATINVKVPSAVQKTYTALSAARTNAVRRGNMEEDDSEGHALMKDSTGRLLQQKFIGYANQYKGTLHNIIHRSSDAAQRAIAAEVIAYADDKISVLPDLLYAIHDNDENVRNNATRALGLFAGSTKYPDLRKKIPADPFIGMIRSLIWTDRNKASLLLLYLTQDRPAALLTGLKQKALPELAEMAAWKDRSHSYTSYLILGRIAGLPEAEITKAFYSTGREAYLEEMLRKIK